MHAYDLYLLLCIKCTFKKLAIDSEHLLSNSCLNASYWIFDGGAAGDLVAWKGNYEEQTSGCV